MVGKVSTQCARCTTLHTLNCMCAVQGVPAGTPTGGRELPTTRAAAVIHMYVALAFPLSHHIIHMYVHMYTLVSLHLYKYAQKTLHAHVHPHRGKYVHAHKHTHMYTHHTAHAVQLQAVLTGCMVPPATTTALHSSTTSAKCTAGFSRKKRRHELCSSPVSVTDTRPF